MSTYFFRVVEQEDGSWLCRWGRAEFDFHAQLDDAIEHTIGIASEYAPSKVLAHHLDGRVQTVATPWRVMALGLLTVQPLPVEDGEQLGSGT